MLITPHARAGAVRWGKRALPSLTLTARRGFFFSGRLAAQDPQGPGTRGPETGWTASDSAGAADAALAAAAAAAAYNYDQASFDRLLACQVAVLFQPKDRTETNVFKRRLLKNAPASAAPAELLPLGEDNLFVSTQFPDGSLAVGVADGVGGWAEAGYDSSAILRELCHFAKAQFEQNGPASPRDLLVKAFHEVQQSPRVAVGGTTACFGVLAPSRRLTVANLGDSWCGVFRNHALVHETKVQTHNFNTPYQLAKIPPQVLRQAQLQGKRYIVDSPEMCDEYAWDLEKDDVVVFATDGVTDNIVPQDIGMFLQDQSAEGRSLGETALRLVLEVVKVAKDPNFPSAFAQELSRLTGQRYMGGKEDDVTIVMLKVL